MPFGEEIGAGIGGRTQAQGYSQADGVRQQFTGKERDAETGLDFFESRYYGSNQGRFTSVDSYNINLERQSIANKHKAESLFVAYLALPQQWNRYSYAINNPLRYIDPTGESIELTGDADARRKQLQQARDYVGSQAGTYLYEKQEANGKYYIGIYTNGPDGRGPAFEQINAAAAELAPIIQHQEVATLHLMKAGETISWVENGALFNNTRSMKFGPIDNLSTGPGLTLIRDGKIDVYLLDPSTGSEGLIPPSQMQDGRPGSIYPGEVFGHEMGHVRAQMFREPDSNGAALRMENKGRKLKDSKAPNRLTEKLP
jgi:RHS repeat-associated protein